MGPRALQVISIPIGRVFEERAIGVCDNEMFSQSQSIPSPWLRRLEVHQEC